MPTSLIVFLVVLGLVVTWLVVQTRRAGPRQLSDMDLARAIVLRSVTAQDPGDGWSALGSMTTAEGLSLKFDHDDDPEAEASFSSRASRSSRRDAAASDAPARPERPSRS